MSKQYYDKPITAATNWGGDSSTGGLQVKRSRVQEWIKAQIAALESADRSAFSRLDTAEANIKAYKTPSLFDGFVSGVTALQQSVTDYDAIVFDEENGYFLAQKGNSLTAKYYLSWPDLLKYAPSVKKNPYTGKLYINGGDIYVWDEESETLLFTGESVKEDIAKALANGTILPLLAGNIESWSERNATVEDSFTDAVRTAAGDESIDSDKEARLVSIVAVSDFKATALRATGFNLLHGATAVGGGYYFAVPKLTFGTYGTADENNGVLFTNKDGLNITPTVRFKALSAGVPQNVNDGTLLTHTEAGGLHFFTTTGPGYLIVTGITLANTCAHIAWSRRYNEFISPTAAGDAGSSVALTAIINACHDFGLLLAASDGNGVVADRIDFGDTQATWTRRVNRVKPTWETVQNEDGSYTHTATISGMKEGGIAECGDLQLEVVLNTVSYTDENSAATTDYVKYELATEATGTVSISPTYSVEDWGLELLDGVTGEAEVTVRYGQGFPDAVAALLASRDNMLASIGGNEARISDVEDLLTEPSERADYDSLPLLMGQPMKLYGAGTPAEATVPDNWIGIADGGYAWVGTPTAIGQEYIDTENGGKYEAAWNDYAQRTLKWLKV